MREPRSEAVLGPLSGFTGAPTAVTIFVSIPSYRDRELLPTLQDCFRKARWPDDLRIGLCWQRDATETLGAFAEDRRLRVADVPYMESRGAGWARSKCAGFYDGEDFVLQIDSHHRFGEDWDAKLIDMMGRTTSRKPVLTTYPPAYDPIAGTFGNWPTQIGFVDFSPQGMIVTVGRPLPPETDAPLPGRFFACGLSFSVGRFLEDVPPDPSLYFMGEEACLCVRAFTHGYDLFHPDKVVLWHLYARRGHAKHWDDHTEAAQSQESLWHELEQRGVSRFRRLLGIDPPDPSEDFGPHGLGAERTLHDYERYAGLSFTARAIEVPTAMNEPPPSPFIELDDDEWRESLLTVHRVKVIVERRALTRWLGKPRPLTLLLKFADGSVQERPLTTEETAKMLERRRSAVGISYMSREPACEWQLTRETARGASTVLASGEIVSA